MSKNSNIIAKSINHRTIYIPQTDTVRVTRTQDGALKMLWYKQAYWNRESPIERLNEDLYVVKSTGEVKEYKKTQGKTLDAGERAAHRFAEIVYENVTTENGLFLSVNYATQPEREQMSRDLESLIAKIRRQCNAHVEYICRPELQERGVWHLHIILIYPEGVNPYVDWYWLDGTWTQGGKWVKRVYDVGGLVDYLCEDLYDPNELAKYPADMKLFTKSGGIREPETELITKQEFDEMVRGMTRTDIKSEHTTDKRTGYQNLRRCETWIPTREPEPEEEWDIFDAWD